MTVVVADLDLLRNINNTYGHLAGDQVLVGVAEHPQGHGARLRRCGAFRRRGIHHPDAGDGARSCIGAGGDDPPGDQSARFEVATSTTPIQVTMSFGVAGRVHPRQTPQEIMHAADVAVYQAKLSGRNRIILADASRAATVPTPIDLPHADVTIKVPTQSAQSSMAAVAPVYRPSRWTSNYIGLAIRN